MVKNQNCIVILNIRSVHLVVDTSNMQNDNAIRFFANFLAVMPEFKVKFGALV